MEIESYINFNSEVLLKELKSYQYKIVEKLLLSVDQNPEMAAEKWLTMMGSPNIAAFGGLKTPKPFWDNFKNEFYRFLCDDTAYADDKELLNKESPITKTISISSISAILGHVLGISAALLAPAVVLMLIAVSKMGIKAYCMTKIKN